MARGLAGKNRVYGRCSECKESHVSCPMGCGLLTDDCLDGPCSECWADLDNPEGWDERDD